MRVFLDECDYLIHLVRCAIHNSQPQELPEHLDFQRVYEYGEYHHIANIAFYSVKKLERKPDATLYSQWSACCDKAVIRDINQGYARDEIVSEFKQADIRFLEVQGTKIKALYPQPEYRTMSDIDFIIDLQNLPKARELLQRLGYTCQVKPDVEVDAFRPPNINIELHAHYFYPGTDYYGILPPPFSSVEKTGEYDVSDFYLYNMLHIMKHYFYGGCGIRRVLDVYYLNQNYGSVINQEYVQATLNTAKVADLVAELALLAEKWFGNEAPDAMRSELESYIIQSGLHGHRHNRLDNRLDKAFDSSVPFAKSKYLLRRFLGTKEIMYAAYPILKRHRFLYPFCWVHRALRGLRPAKRKIVKREIKIVLDKKPPQ